MPNKAKAKGTRVENELANLLWEMGYAVVRGPSSGAGVRRRFQPDLVAIKAGKVLVFEVKTYRGGGPLYIPRHQVDGLKDFADRAGAHAFIAVRLHGGGWRLHRLEDLPATRGGGARVDEPSTGLRPRDLDELLFPTSRRITEYI